MEKKLKRRVMIITFDSSIHEQEKIMAHFTGIHDDYDYRAEFYPYEKDHYIPTATILLYSTTETAPITAFEGLAKFLDEEYPLIQYSIHEHTYKKPVEYIYN